MRIDEILIDRSPGEIRIALCAKGRLIELDIDRDSSPSHVGSIFLGRVKHISGSTAWIDIGSADNRLGFLDISRGPSRLTEGSTVIVQVVRDSADSTGERKGPLLSTTMAVSGPHLIYRPEKPGFEAPKKIGGPEARALLEEALRDQLIDKEGLVFRAAAGARALRDDNPKHLRRILLTELESLRQRWQKIKETAEQYAAPKLLEEMSFAVGIILTYGGPAVRIETNDRRLNSALRQKLRTLAPEWSDEIDLTASSDEIFARHDLEDQISAALSPIVSLPKGASLIIETTSALTSIDINGAGQTDPLAVNTSAVSEIARQVRLRGLGGLILIDALRMTSGQHRQRILASLKQSFAADPVTVDILGFTSSGLIEITRKRQVSSLVSRLLTPSSKLFLSAETAALTALRHVIRYADLHQGQALTITGAPDLIAALKDRLNDAVSETQTRLGSTLGLVSDLALGPDKFHISAQKL